MTTHIGAKTKRELVARLDSLEQQLNLCQTVNRNHDRDERTLREHVARLQATPTTIGRIAALP